MPTNAALIANRPSRASQDTLREVCETLAELEREAGSEGEREAAEWLAARFERTGARTRIDEEEFFTGWPELHATLSAAGAAAGALALTGKARRTAAAAGLATAALLADDASNGARPARKFLGEARTTWNVVAELGDPDAERTFVLLAHHDAAHGGRIFDQTLQRKLSDWFPGVIERFDTAVPLWWGVAGGPALTAIGALTRRRGLSAAGAVLSVASTLGFRDIARSPVVPGASDNLSGVASLVALAELFAAQPVEGLRVVLASCGAEEVLQGGIYGFCRRHLAPLDRDHTWVLNLDTVGSPELVMLEGEGCFVMEDYFDRGFRDLIAETARRDGIRMRRGMRAATSTDAVIPSRMGIPTACLVSLNRHKGLSNYHSPTDVPERLSYPTIGAAADLAEAVVREFSPQI